MCMCGCEYENGCGDCTVNLDYCEFEKLDRIKNVKEEIETLERTIKADEEKAISTGLDLWLDTLKDELKELENIK